MTEGVAVRFDDGLYRGERAAAGDFAVALRTKLCTPFRIGVPVCATDPLWHTPSTMPAVGTRLALTGWRWRYTMRMLATGKWSKTEGSWKMVVALRRPGEGADRGRRPAADHPRAATPASVVRLADRRPR